MAMDHSSVEACAALLTLCSEEYGGGSSSGGTSGRSTPVAEQSDHSTTDNKNSGQESSRVDNNDLGSSPLQLARPPSPPDLTCPICLGRLENRSYTDTCFHKFCFVCLVEWSKVRPVCPLCKQQFTSIIHNIRSYSEFEQFPISQNAAANGGINSAESRNRFRYRTTVVGGSSERRRQLDLLQRPSRYRRRGESRFNDVPPVYTSAFRRSIYRDELWVHRVADAGRIRDTSAVFFHRNPACSHRLVPWLNRELMALLRDSGSVAFLLDVILSTIARIDIRSDTFHDLVVPFLGARSRHFIHEFHSYASSPFDMAAYDTRAVYERPVHVAEARPIEFTDDSADDSSDDDDDVVEVNRIPGRASADSATSLSTLVEQSRDSRTSRQIGNLSDSVSVLQTNAAIRRMFSEAWPSLTMSNAAFRRPGSPVPGPSHSSSIMSLIRDNMNSRLSGSALTTSSEELPLAAGLSNNQIRPSLSTAVAAEEVDSDGEVVIVAVDKPWRERSPVLLMSSDESDVENNPTVSRDNNSSSSAELAGFCEVIGHVSPHCMDMSGVTGAAGERNSSHIGSSTTARAHSGIDLDIVNGSEKKGCQHGKGTKRKHNKHHHHHRHRLFSHRDCSDERSEGRSQEGGNKYRSRSHHRKPRQNSPTLSADDARRDQERHSDAVQSGSWTRCDVSKSDSRTLPVNRTWLSDSEQSDDEESCRRTLHSVVVMPQPQQTFKKHPKGHKRTVAH